MRTIHIVQEVLAVNQDKMRTAGGRVGFHNCSEGKEVCQVLHALTTIQAFYRQLATNCLSDLVSAP